MVLGHKFVAVATDAQYLRIFSHTGAPRSLLCLAGQLVALAAAAGLMAVVEHAGVSNQHMTISIFDMREPGRPVRLSTGPMPLSRDATLHWLGFSQAGGLSSVDSNGVVRQCMRGSGFEWVPLMHTASIKKTKQEHHWVVGITETQLMCAAPPPSLPRVRARAHAHTRASRTGASSARARTRTLQRCRARCSRRCRSRSRSLAPSPPSRSSRATG